VPGAQQRVRLGHGELALSGIARVHAQRDHVDVVARAGVQARLRRPQRHQDHVRGTAVRARAGQHADNRNVLRSLPVHGDMDGLPDRVGALAKGRFDEQLVDHGNRCCGLLVGVGYKAPAAHLAAVDVEPVRLHADHLPHLQLLAAVHSDRAVQFQLCRDPVERGTQFAQCLHVTRVDLRWRDGEFHRRGSHGGSGDDGFAGGSRLYEHRSHVAHQGPDLDVPAAEHLHLLGGGTRESVPERDDHNHGADANDDAEHRQPGAQFAGAKTLQSKPEVHRATHGYMPP